MKLKLVHRDDGWWIEGDESHGPYGPYTTKYEAEDDKEGLERFYNKHMHEKPTYVPPPPKPPKHAPEPAPAKPKRTRKKK